MCKDNVVAPLTVFSEEKGLEFLAPPQEISISVRKKGFDVQAIGYGEDFLLQLVDKLSKKDVQAEVVVKPPTIAVNGTPSVEAIKSSINKVMNATSDSKPVYSTGDESTSTLADKFGDKSKELYAKAGVEHKEQDTDFYHTGIKFDDYNRPKYRCGYNCPKCANTGRHYIPTHITRVSCHNCQTPLVVEPATEKGFGEKDEYRDTNGNFFVAEVIDYTHTSRNGNK